MNNKIKYVKRYKLVIVVTAIAILLANIINYFMSYFYQGFVTPFDLLRSTLIPLILAPLIAGYLTGVFSEMVLLEKKLNRLATYDDLTGLLNRRAFLQNAQTCYSYARRYKQTFCVLALDFDYFKKINDQYGHSVGDMVLSEFGQLMNEIKRESDLCGRLGGEEFAFFLPNTDMEHGKIFAKKIQQAILDHPLKVTDQNIINYTVSIGISSLVFGNQEELGQILLEADKALYTAKKSGRNQFIAYNK